MCIRDRFSTICARFVLCVSLDPVPWDYRPIGRRGELPSREHPPGIRGENREKLLPTSARKSPNRPSSPNRRAIPTRAQLIDNEQSPSIEKTKTAPRALG